MAVRELNEIDREILTVLQKGFPMVPRPYEAIADMIGEGLTGEKVIQRIDRMKQMQVIRRISGFFESDSLGYCSMLLAVEPKEGHFEEAAAFINQYPGVTHNYARSHVYSIWFTLIAANRATLEHILNEIEGSGHVEKMMRFSMYKRYKINVTFDMKRQKRDDYQADTADAERFSQSQDGRSFQKECHKLSSKGNGNLTREISEQEKAIIRALQQDLPLVTKPYKVLADSLGIDEDAFLAGANDLQRQGRMKRVGVSLFHQNVGYTINVMVVWNIPDELVDKVGKKISVHPSVTHCYCRCRHEDFPYNFYTMVHCQSDEEYECIIEELHRIMEDILPCRADYTGLRTLRELKKSGMLYFNEKPGEVITE